MRKAIGIDIGGTKISVGVINEGGAIEAQTRLPTASQQGFDSGIQRISAAIRQVMAIARCEKLEGIGIGCAGPLNPFTGVIHNDFTLPGWGGCNIVQPLSQAFGIPVYLENDADAALAGEAFAGAGRGDKALVMLTFGTGVGGAAMTDGRIYRGAGGEHPEIGHVPIDPTGPNCYCGRSGCLESIASGAAIGEAGNAAGFKDAEEVFTRAKQGNPAAAAIVSRAVRACALGLWTIIHTLLPERVIFGGGVMEAHYELFEPALEAEVKRARLGPMCGMRLCRAELANDAGLVGAGVVAMNNGLR